MSKLSLFVLSCLAALFCVNVVLGGFTLFRYVEIGAVCLFFGCLDSLLASDGTLSTVGCIAYRLVAVFCCLLLWPLVLYAGLRGAWVEWRQVRRLRKVLDWPEDG